MEKRSFRIGPIGAALLLAASFAVGGCTETRKALGWEKAPPDEFRVVTRAPLTLPPDYGLRPPAPGAARPNETSPQDSARAAVFGADRAAVLAQTARAAAGSPGEQMLLTRAGADRADPAIRDQIDRESQSLAEADKTFVDRLLFWRKNEPGAGEQLNASREAQRLREASAEGRPAADGEVPTIRKRQRGWLEGIF